MIGIGEFGGHLRRGFCGRVAEEGLERWADEMAAKNEETVDREG